MQQQAALGNSIVSAGLTDDADAQASMSKALLALLSKTTSSGAGTTGVGNAFVAASRNDPHAAGGVFANTALHARDSNRQKEFADSAAQGLVQANQQGSLPSYVDTLTNAITGAGDHSPEVTQTIGQAIATASATVDGKEAVANATATAICAGDQTAVAISQAVSTAISINPATGCASVGLAIGTAVATCGQLALTNSKSFASVFDTCHMDPTALADSLRATFGAGGITAADVLASRGAGAAAGNAGSPAGNSGAALGNNGDGGAEGVPAAAVPGQAGGSSNSNLCRLVDSAVGRAALGCR